MVNKNLCTFRNDLKNRDSRLHSYGIQNYDYPEPVRGP